MGLFVVIFSTNIGEIKMINYYAYLLANTEVVPAGFNEASSLVLS